MIRIETGDGGLVLADRGDVEIGRFSPEAAFLSTALARAGQEGWTIARRPPMEEGIASLASDSSILDLVYWIDATYDEITVASAVDPDRDPDVDN